jgi:hypothetical protein
MYNQFFSNVWSVAVLIVLSALVIRSEEVREVKADKGPARPAELKVLDRLIGSWEWETVSKPAVWTPEEVKAKGTLTREWVLNDRFVMEKGGTKDSPNWCMFTFDEQRKTYRFWIFTSTGNTMEFAGQWDEKSETMTWKCDLGNGITSSGPQHFIDKDNLEFHAVAKDKEGKIYHDLMGKIKRKK